MAAVSHRYFPNPSHSVGTPCFCGEKATNLTNIRIPLVSPVCIISHLICIQGFPAVYSILYVMPISNGHPLKIWMCVMSCRASASQWNVDFTKRPWHGSVGRRCSCRATERTGLCVIWHTVKDRRNLHSNCVPVGRVELCLSLAMLLLAPIPKLASALLRELEGGPVSEFTVAGCHFSPSSTYSSIRIHRHVYTHSTESERELFSTSISKVLQRGFNLSWIAPLKFREWTTSIYILH